MQIYIGNSWCSIANRCRELLVHVTVLAYIKLYLNTNSDNTNRGCCCCPVGNGGRLYTRRLTAYWSHPQRSTLRMVTVDKLWPSLEKTVVSPSITLYFREQPWVPPPPHQLGSVHEIFKLFETSVANFEVATVLCKLYTVFFSESDIYLQSPWEQSWSSFVM